MPPPAQRASRRPAAPAAPAEVAGAAPYVWFLSAALLVFALDQMSFRATRPAGQPFELLDGGLAAAVAVAWRRGSRWWPAVALAGAASALLLKFQPWWAAPVLYAAGLVVAANSARVLLEMCGFDGRVRHLTDVLALAALAGPAAGFIAAMLGAAVPELLKGGEWGAAVEALVAQWFSGWIGVLLLTPFLLSLGADYFQRWSPARMWEWVLVNLLLVASLLAMMRYLDDDERYWFPMAYLALPWIFWTAWRFGLAGAALAGVLVGAIVSLCAWDGIGPFVGEGLTTLLLAWSFLGFHGFIALTFAAVTDERRLELAQLRQRARFLRQVFDQLPCGVLLKDIHDQPVLVNRRWFQFFGKPGGTEEDQLRHQQSIEPFWRARELTLMQNLGDAAREEADSTDHEGKPVELLLTKQAAYFEERGDRLLMVVADEISRGRASLRELRATLERMHATLGVAEVSLWEWHIPTGIIRFDAQFSKLTGVPVKPEGLAVAEWQESIHLEDRPYFQHAMLRHLHHQEELFAARFRFRRPDGWVWLVVRGRVVEQDVRKLGVRMVGTLQEARATVLPLPDPNAPPSDK